MLQSLKHKLVMWVKTLIYSASGEPYALMGKTLRFVPGTRPVLTKYRNSPNDISRYDALQVELICERLQAGDFAMDIGAHAGQYGLIMASICGPGGKVITFEPDWHARELLVRNMALNPDVTCLKVEALAMSDTNGSATLFSRGGDSNSSLSMSSLPADTGTNVELLEVPLRRFDDYMRDNGLPLPKFVKIDTEGAEIRILKGAESLLASDAVIICELHPYAWEGFGNSLAELEEVLAKSGRQMRYLDQTQPIAGEPVYGVVMLDRKA